MGGEAFVDQAGGPEGEAGANGGRTGMCRMLLGFIGSSRMLLLLLMMVVLR